MADSGGRTLYVVTPRGERGPLDRGELRELLNQGEVGSTDQVRTAFGSPLGSVNDVLRARHASDRTPAANPHRGRQGRDGGANKGLPVQVFILAGLGVILLIVLLVAFSGHGTSPTLIQPPEAEPDRPVAPPRPRGLSLIPNSAPTEKPVLAGLEPGLTAAYYRDIGDSENLPDFANLTPVLTRVDHEINERGEGPWPGTDLSDCFAIRWTGVLRITEPGSYTLALVSDDGSQLFIDGRKVILNGGSHEMREMTWTSQLSVGDHPLVLEFFQGHGPRGCQLAWWSDNAGRKVIGDTNLLHQPGH